MEKALILITLKLKSSSNLLEQVKAIPSVTDAEMVYGPYDAYAVLESKTKEELRDSVMKIRQIYGVHNTLTCNVIP
jgi:nitrate reductase NapAB chaperone NapD